MTTVNVNSIDSLEDLATSIARFASVATEAIEAAQRQIQKKIECLDQVISDRRRAISVLQSVCDDADDDDDLDSLRKQFEEAEEELRVARRWRRVVEEVCADYKKPESQANHLASKHADKSRLFLKTRISELNAFIASKPDSSRIVFNNSHGTGSEPTDIAPITSLSLPKRFGWVQLDDLMTADMDELPTESDYRKGISESEMQEGLGLLQTRVLPEIQNDESAANIEHFLDLDRAEKRSGPNSLANIFAAYFGDSRIRVSRLAGDPHFRIENGRHRIKAARDLGWNAVPAEIVEVSRSEN